MALLYVVKFPFVFMDATVRLDYSAALESIPVNSLGCST